MISHKLDRGIHPYLACVKKNGTIQFDPSHYVQNTRHRDFVQFYFPKLLSTTMEPIRINIKAETPGKYDISYS